MKLAMRAAPRRPAPKAHRAMLAAAIGLCLALGAGACGGAAPEPRQERGRPASGQGQRPPSTSEAGRSSPDRGARPAEEDEDRSALVWAVGDGADGSAPAKRLGAAIAASDPDRLLYLGDVYETGTSDEFRRNYDSVYGSLSRVTSPTPGNHDWANHEQGYDPYWKRAHGEPQPSYYSLSIGGWEILSLNSQESVDDDSPQVRWLEDRLRGAEGNCRLAFWHRPRYSAGTTHGDQEDVEPLWTALRGHARLVLAGHEHNSQRFEERDGMTQLVAGAGRGAEPLYGLEDDEKLVFGDDRQQAALRLALEPGRARFAFVNADGEVLDSDAVRCER